MNTRLMINVASIFRKHLMAPMLPIVFVLPLVLLGYTPPALATDTWLSVDTQNLVLSIMRDDVEVHRFDNIAIGSNGASTDIEMGDEKTPIGTFRITEVRASRRFHMFIALDYPTPEHARRALALDLITTEEFDSVERAARLGDPPPHSTPLGGNIGIHGIGRGNPEIHTQFNWTDGCIALTDEQIEALLPWVGRGTRVRIY